MPMRTNIILDEQNWTELQKLPRGERSRVINAALADWMRRRDRARALAEIDGMRGADRGVSQGVSQGLDRGAESSAETLLRRDRRAH